MNNEMIDMLFKTNIENRSFTAIKEIFKIGIQLGAKFERESNADRAHKLASMVNCGKMDLIDIGDTLKAWGEE